MSLREQIKVKTKQNKNNKTIKAQSKAGTMQFYKDSWKQNKGTGRAG